jgi:hypothetical protein
MGGPRHTFAIAVSLLALTTACSFDSSTTLLAGGGGGDPANPDAGSAPDADRQLNPDANQPDANPGVAMGTLTSSPLSGALTLDGELDAQWQALQFRIYDIDDSEQIDAIGSYQPDASVRFASLYDSDKIYFFFEVHDDLLIDNSSSIYNDDSVELYIDGLKDSSGPYSNDDHWIVVSANGTYQSFGPTNLPITGFISTTDVGYNIEIALERSSLGAGDASELGFNIGLNDDDDGGDSDIDAYGLWYLPDTAACESCCADQGGNYAWCDTTRLGGLQLLP